MEVKCLEVMGSDLTVVNAARVSFNKKKEIFEEDDEKLIRYLAKHNHWTPFGHPQISFRIKAPIFVARQLVKHQIGLIWNEVSRRYVEYEPELYLPPEWRLKSLNKKQGSSEETIMYDISEIYDNVVKTYNDMIKKGIAPELARMILPQSLFTEWIWTGSLAAFSRICKLRCTKDSQYETREICNKIRDICFEKFPYSWKYLYINQSDFSDPK